MSAQTLSIIVCSSLLWYTSAMHGSYEYVQPTIGTNEEKGAIATYNNIVYSKNRDGFTDSKSLSDLINNPASCDLIKQEIKGRIDERMDAINQISAHIPGDCIPVIEKQTILNRFWDKKPLRYTHAEIKNPYEFKVPSENATEDQLNKMLINGLVNRVQLYAQLYNQLDAIKEKKARISPLHIELLFDVCETLKVDKTFQASADKKWMQACCEWFEKRNHTYTKAIISACEDESFIDYYIRTYFPRIGGSEQQKYSCTPTLLFLQRVNKNGYKMAANIADFYPSAHPPRTCIGISVIINKKNPIFIEMESWLYDNDRLNHKYLTKDSFSASRVYTVKSETERTQRNDTKYLLEMNPRTLYPYNDASEEGEKRKALLTFIDTLDPLCFFDATYTFTYDEKRYFNNKIREMIRAKPRHHAMFHKFLLFKIMLFHQKKTNDWFCCSDNKGLCHQDRTIIDGTDVHILQEQSVDLPQEIKDIATEWYHNGRLQFTHSDRAFMRHPCWR